MHHYILVPVTRNLKRKNSDAERNCCKYPLIQAMWFDHRQIQANGADGMARSVDHDHIAPEQSVFDYFIFTFKSFCFFNSRLSTKVCMGFTDT